MHHCCRVHQTAGRGRQESDGDRHFEPTAQELQGPVACKHERLRVTWKLPCLLLPQLSVQQSALQLVHTERAERRSGEDADMSWPPGTMPVYRDRQRSLKAAALGTLADAIATVREVQLMARRQVVLHMTGAGTHDSKVGTMIANAHHRSAPQAAA